MTLFIGVGAYFAGITTGAIGRITSGNNEPVDTMVVAVRADDPAKNLSDAKDYTFGVQYTITSDDMKDTVAKIQRGSQVGRLMK